MPHVDKIFGMQYLIKLDHLDGITVLIHDRETLFHYW
jgi:hypothetical protein